MGEATPAISTDQVAHVARLARIELTPAEIEHYTGHLGRVLDHARELEDLDLAEVPPLAHPYPLRNVFRDDIAGPSVDRDEVLNQAPAASDGQFEVPPVLGGES
ncbi:Asp-tRNA(Asn)/Glu-tRNA(Gln) amidotransferase subunit GatC [Candidatus Poriferisodalis sp.]|uniref:Asp-tRNA(Asn)/Glu-tRNA(Gln) amidotransferase subunit GatC n=1 Tax=Candidatus Poriferisodalis sp. TaxID=3101277 RepID=UPI003C6FD211